MKTMSDNPTIIGAIGTPPRIAIAPTGARCDPQTLRNLHAEITAAAAQRSERSKRSRKAS